MNANHTANSCYHDNGKDGIINFFIYNDFIIMAFIIKLPYLENVSNMLGHLRGFSI